MVSLSNRLVEWDGTITGTDSIAWDGTMKTAQKGTRIDPGRPAESTTRQRILEAARQEFTVHGKAGARMERIAATGAVNKAMLYYYYSSKDNLYREVLRSFYEPAFRGMEKLLAEDQKVEAKVRRMVGHFIDYYQKNLRFVRLLQRELADGGRDILALLGESQEARQGLTPQVLIDFMADGVRQGAFRPLDPRHAVLSMVGMCVVMFMIRPILPVMLGLDPDQPELFEQRKVQVGDLLLRGILNPKHQG